MLRARIIYVCIWVLCGVCSIYRREGERWRDECLSIQMTECVRWRHGSCIQTFAGAHPPVKKFSHHHHHVAAQALRSRTHVFAFALVVY